MENRPFILRCAAFLLILAFSQKAGTGLLLHNLFHSTTENTKIPGQENEKGKQLGYNCTCIDDFLMPFAEAEQPICSQPVSDHSAIFIIDEETIPFYTSILSFLRGPPAGLA